KYYHAELAQPQAGHAPRPAPLPASVPTPLPVGEPAIQSVGEPAIQSVAPDEPGELELMRRE
ncbi:MAG: hypothetical protein ACRDNS_29655, partial [Trebonia sp.]